MALEIIKQATNVANACKKAVAVNKPQLTAVLATGCFVGAVYSATQETPGANEAVEKKRAIDPSMSKLEEVAVSIPEYKFTIGLTAAGLGLTYLAWHFEALKYAALAATCAQLADENSGIRNAVREIAGDETAEKVQARVKSDMKEDAGKDIPADRLVVPITFALTGKTVWRSRHEMEQLLNKCLEKLIQTGCLDISEALDILKHGYCELCEKNYYWHCTQGWAEQAKENFEWWFEPNEDEYGRLGYTLHLSNYNEVR